MGKNTYLIKKLNEKKYILPITFSEFTIFLAIQIKIIYLNMKCFMYTFRFLLSLIIGYPLKRVNDLIK